MNFTWSVEALSKIDSLDGLTDVVDVVKFRAVGTPDEGNAISMDIEWKVSVDPDNFQAYNTLTEADILGWRPQLLIDKTEETLEELSQPYVARNWVDTMPFEE